MTEPLPQPAPSVGIVPSRYVRIKPLWKGGPSIASLVTGMSLKTIQQKIDTGVWLEGREWRRGPDGNRYLDVRGYEEWVARGRACE